MDSKYGVAPALNRWQKASLNTAKRKGFIPTRKGFITTHGWFTPNHDAFATNHHAWLQPTMLWFQIKKLLPQLTTIRGQKTVVLLHLILILCRLKRVLPSNKVLLAELCCLVTTHDAFRTSQNNSATPPSCFMTAQNGFVAF
jgi:hypothetical protein